jgi:predicted XRE-type DNA-binding protein
MPKTQTPRKPVDLDKLIRDKGLSADSVEQLKQKLTKQQSLFALRQLRSLTAMTQVQLAQSLGVTQNRISKLERYELGRLELQTIRSYIDALGGELSLVVELDGVQHKIEIPM